MYTENAVHWHINTLVVVLLCVLLYAASFVQNMVVPNTSVYGELGSAT